MVIVTRQAEVTNKPKVWAQFRHLGVKPLGGEKHKRQFMNWVSGLNQMRFMTLLDSAIHPAPQNLLEEESNQCSPTRCIF